jgi:arylsulfatase A-like enzyme
VGKYGVGKIDPSDFDFVRQYEGRHWLTDDDGERIHITAKNLRDSLEFLKDRPQDKPFCLSVSFFAAHAQDNAPEQYLPQPWSEKLYAGAVIPMPKTATDEHFRRLPPFLATDLNEGRVRWKKRFDTPQKYQTYMKNYYRLVSETDDAIGKILAELKSQGVYENTFIVFTADNGYFHGEHGLADKWYPYEEALRVPLIVRDPRERKARVGRESAPRERTWGVMALNIDLAPTLLRAAGVDPPATMQGTPLQSLYQDVRSRAPRWRREFYYEHPVILGKDRIPRSEAVILNQWRYIYWPDYEFEELYNLDDDPYQEHKDGKEKHPEMLVDMRERLKQCRDKAK